MPSKSKTLGWEFLNAVFCNIILMVHLCKICGIPSICMEQEWYFRCWSPYPTALKAQPILVGNPG